MDGVIAHSFPDGEGWRGGSVRVATGACQGVNCRNLLDKAANGIFLLLNFFKTKRNKLSPKKLQKTQRIDAKQILKYLFCV